MAPGADGWAVVEASRKSFSSELVSVSPVAPNIRSVSGLAHLAGEALSDVGCQGGAIAVILSDLTVRAFSLPVERRTKPEQMLAKVATRLPYPSHEAVFDTWRGGSGWALVAAVRRAVLGQYEEAVEAIGCRASWVDGASLIKIPDWSMEARPDGPNGPAEEDESDGDAPPLRVHVQRYPDHYSLSVFRGGELVDVRVKLNGAGDDARIADELARLPAMCGGAQYRQVSVQGEGAAALFEKLGQYDEMRECLLMGEDGHQAHLAALMAAIVRRG
jgi:hypothetical protein